MCGTWVFLHINQPLFFSLGNYNIYRARYFTFPPPWGGIENHTFGEKNEKRKKKGKERKGESREKGEKTKKSLKILKFSAAQHIKPPAPARSNVKGKIFWKGVGEMISM